MTSERISQLLALGENIVIEFKRCGNGVEFDTYQTVCSFLNRFGGDILLGVEDDGTVVGVPKNAARDMVKNIISTVSNSAMFSPCVYLEPRILEYDGRTIIHIHVPRDAEVYHLKGVIYDRVDDADIKLTSTSKISELCIRKQNIYTELRVYPYIELEELRLDLLPKVRMMAQNHLLSGTHPWKDMSDMELLKSAGLYRKDENTGKSGFTLAAVMLLGKDELIKGICPNYKTDALLRKVNIDRYDDRCIVETNLIDSYRLLTDFAAKHLLDKFFLEGQFRVSLAGVISREMLANTLIHREYLSHYPAKFVIMKDKMFVENACRAREEMDITPENLDPDSKNPTIAAFFRNIGFADELGSGVRRLFKYVPFYSNAQPSMHEADVFRITVPLDDLYSYDEMTVPPTKHTNVPPTADPTAAPTADPTVGIQDDRELGPSSGETGPSSGETGPSSGETGPSGGETGPSGGETGPSSGETGPSNTAAGLGSINFNAEHVFILRYLDDEKGFSELLNAVQRTNRTKFRKKILLPLLLQGYIEATQPNSPNSPTQKYRLTAKGQAFLKEQNHE